MLRIHFSSEDLSRIRFAPGPDWFWELLLSIHQLRVRESHPFLGSWKQAMRQRFHPGGTLRARTATALAISPPLGYFPDFLTPPDEGFDSGIEAIMSTQRRRLRREIGVFAESHEKTPQIVRDVGRGEPEAMRALGSALRAYRDAALAPLWNQVSAAVDADRQRRLRQLSAGGWSAVLDNLHPQARFAGNTLEVAVWGRADDSELGLDGRGLTLIPSYFKETRQLMLLADFDLPPVLVYPVDPGLRVLSDADHTPLGALIGATRSRILELAADRNTSEIAKLVDISVPAASKHLAVLRQNNLIASVRHGGMVVHSATALGLALLNGAGKSQP